MNLAWAVVFVVACTISVATTLHWTSSNELPSNATKIACSGNNVTLPWKYETDADELVLDVEWMFQAKGHGEEMMATSVRGNFFAAPTTTQTIQYLPNAGLNVLNVATRDTGLYTVNVNVNLHGSIVMHSQTVYVDVAEDCNAGRLAMLEAHMTNLQTENTLLRSELGVQHEQILNLTKQLYQLAQGHPPQQQCSTGATLLVRGPADCQEILQYDANSGVHTVYPNQYPVKVYCDQDTDGGGWTVIQRRVSTAVSFPSFGWNDYELGFGDLTANFWLGLTNIYRLTNNGDYSLRVDLEDWDSSTAYATYDSFRIDAPIDHCRLHISGYNGTAGDSMTLNNSSFNLNGRPFTTKDRDNDRYSAGNCASACGHCGYGGWWYNDCTLGSLNGYMYGAGSAYSYGLTWYTWKNDYRSLKRAEMKIRPRAQG